MLSPTSCRHGNLQKHLNPNPLQRYLLRRFHHRIVELVRQVQPSSLLDAGCGQGFTLRALEQAGLSAATMGADLDGESLAWGRAHNLSRAPLVAADVLRLPFADCSFDLVLCLEVLEHLAEPGRGLTELLRLTRRHVLVSVPHEPWFRLANLLRGKHVAALGNDPEHVQQFSWAALRRLAAAQADVLWHGTSFPWQMALLARRS